MAKSGKKTTDKIHKGIFDLRKHGGDRLIMIIECGAIDSRVFADGTFANRTLDAVNEFLAEHGDGKPALTRADVIDSEIYGMLALQVPKIRAIQTCNSNLFLPSGSREIFPSSLQKPCSSRFRARG